VIEGLNAAGLALLVISVAVALVLGLGELHRWWTARRSRPGKGGPRC
jgi:hypothetical protein